MPLNFGVILPANPRGKNTTTSQINPGTSDENNNSKVCTIKILLDSTASASIVRKDVLYEHHKILGRNLYYNFRNRDNILIPRIESLREKIRKIND